MMAESLCKLKICCRQTFTIKMIFIKKKKRKKTNLPLYNKKKGSRH